MKMKHMSKSIFSIILIISVSLTALSQETKQKSDTIKIPQRYGLRLGLDLHRITKSFYDKNLMTTMVIAAATIAININFIHELLFLGVQQSVLPHPQPDFDLFSFSILLCY